MNFRTNSTLIFNYIFQCSVEKGVTNYRQQMQRLGDAVPKTCFYKAIENVVFKEIPAVLRHRCCFYGWNTSTTCFHALQSLKLARITNIQKNWNDAPRSCYEKEIVTNVMLDWRKHKVKTMRSRNSSFLWVIGGLFMCIPILLYLASQTNVAQGNRDKEASELRHAVDIKYIEFFSVR